MRGLLKVAYAGLGVLILSWMMAACGPLPQPFQPSDKSANKLLSLEDTPGILVLPIEGSALGDRKATAEGMAEALRERNLPATTRSAGHSSRLLRSNAAVLPLSPEVEEVYLRMELIENDGSRIGLHTERQEFPAGAWEAGSPAVVDQVVDRAAVAIAEMVQRPEAKEALIPGFPGARFVILPMKDLPGDGQKSLPSSLAFQLKNMGYPVVEEITDDDILIAGEVVLTETNQSYQHMTVTWRVLRATTGEVLGQIDQANDIPRGSLDGAWGVTARAIAQGAAMGILQLIDQLDQV